MLKKHIASLLAFGAIFTLPQISQAQVSGNGVFPFDRMIIFGDSLSDIGAHNGLKNDRDLEQAGDILPNIVKRMDGQGRISNGPVWNEYIVPDQFQAYKTGSLGSAGSWLLPGRAYDTKHVDFFKDDNLKKVINLAVLGANILPLEGVYDRVIPSMGKQMEDYLWAANNQNKPAFTKNDLFALWAGANDVLKVGDEFVNAGKKGNFNSGHLDNAATKMKELLELSYTKGARQFLLPTIPDVSLTPHFKAVPETKDMTEYLNSKIDDVLTGFVQAHPDITIYRPNTADAIRVIKEYAADFGFTHVDEGCFDVQACRSASADVQKPYLFWDDMHPSTYGHGYFAEYFRQYWQNPDIAGSYVKSPKNMFTTSRHFFFPDKDMVLATTFKDDGALYKLRNSKLTITGENSYKGGTFIRQGSLQIGDGGQTGSITGNVEASKDTKLIFDRSNDYQFDGIISGEGGVVKNGLGNTVLTAGSTYTGGTFVKAGRLQIGNGGATGSITGNVEISSDAELIFDRWKDYQFDGIISGEGFVVKNGRGNMILTADSTYTGGTFIKAGRLQIGNGGATGAIAGNVEASKDTKLIFDRSNDYQFDGIISGAGGVVKNGRGNMILTADSTYTGDTFVKAGRLQVDGSLESKVLVNSGAILGGNGTIGALHVKAGGTVSPGNSIGQLKVLGDAIFSKGSTFLVEFGDKGNDQLEVEGNVSLRGGVVQIRKDGGERLASANDIMSNLGNSRPVIQATGIITGQFEEVEKYNFLDLKVDYSNGMLEAKLVEQPEAVAEAPVAPPADQPVAQPEAPAVATTAPVEEKPAEQPKVVAEAPVTPAVDQPVSQPEAPVVATTAPVEEKPAEQPKVVAEAPVTPAVDQPVSQPEAQVVVTTAPVVEKPAEQPEAVAEAPVAPPANQPVAQPKETVVKLDKPITAAGKQDRPKSEIKVTVTKNARQFQSLGKSHNERVTLDAIEKQKKGALYTLIGASTANEDLNAKALVADVHASLQGALIGGGQFISNAATSRIRDAFGGITIMQQSVQAPVASSGATAFWGEAYGSWAHAEGNGNAAGYSRNVGGLVTGFDGMATEAVRIGLLVGYSDTSLNAGSSRASAQSYQIGLYGGSQWDALGLRFGANLARHEVDTRRKFDWKTQSFKNEASYGASMAGLFGELGYSVKTGFAAFEPFAGISHTQLKTDGFGESGTDSDITGLAATTNVTMTSLGIRASQNYVLSEGVALTARGMLGWNHAFGDVTPESRLAFAGGDHFTVEGLPIAQDTLNAEAGFDVNFGESTRLGITYRGQFSNGASDNSVKANLAVRF